MVFCGDEKYRKFKGNLRRVSEDKYELKFIQEKRLDDFRESEGHAITPADVLAALSDGTEYIYHCPTKACGFIAECINDQEDVWACGECGTQWSGRKAFFSSIEESILTFPYRKALYKKRDGQFLPVDPNTYPKKLRDNIEGEWG
ncbi:hypothetical protein QWI17_08290 [Gilvimarinus sp. SDUM040013]|uniref:Uncharacterized protein n=1 Tax=Gilvimarinus gilvus TaxID=3058038 RepID=A0ABU4S646_9GAMM|nr:hypothetical protein [Gilvimarinus sp. SDUM040013]MDO3385833.1 hypothetical protein [Gilvimarinus sp. SDUM040013]MDX6851378.1 hypothetical protein [Gilvimarinus sp. SDUM040013]